MMLGGSPISVAVAGEHLRKQERVNRHLQLAADKKRHRHHQQNGGDVVEKGGEDRGDQRQRKQDSGGRPARELRRLYRHITEQPALPRHRHHDHHADEQADGVKIDRADRLLLVEHAERDQRPCPEQCHNRAVDEVRDNQRIHHYQRRGRGKKGERLRVVALRHMGVSRAKPTPLAPTHVGERGKG
jgi:hypothetical protein